MVFTIFLTSLIISLIAGYVVKLIYLRYHWLDQPALKPHVKHTHIQPVPRGGGIIIYLAIFLSSLIFFKLDKHLIGILSGGFLLMLMGFLDDLYNLHPKLRLIGGFIAGLIVVGSGIGIAYVSNPFGGVFYLDQPQIVFHFLGKLHTIWILSDLFALFWILWCMNMLNWSKGIDGQLSSIVVPASIIIGLLSLKFVDDFTAWPSINLAFITAGSYLGLWWYNQYPQKLMPGYGAGSLAGYMLAVLSIVSGAKLATAFAVLSLPMLDAIFVMFHRIYHKKSPLWGDRNHFHHILLDRGWGRRRITLFYFLTTTIIGLLALLAPNQYKVTTIIISSLLIGGYTLWYRFLSKS